MASLEILIAGGGVAGPCLAWWLNKAKVSAHITIIERSPVPRVSGQAVDIRDFGVDVIRRMGLEEAIRAKTTTEEGIEFVWNDGKKKTQFLATGDASAQSFTSEFEILRGDLAKIFYDETKESAEYVFGEYITGIYQERDGSSKARVTFANGRPEGLYDLVVGADGMMSKTRQIVFGNGPDDNYYLKSLGQWMAFYTIPRISSDTKFAQWYMAEKGRVAMTRPSQYNDTRAYLAVTDSNLSRFGQLASTRGYGKEEQIAFLEKEFEGAGWQTKRLVEGLRSSQDFYMQETAQVKIAEFVKGRVALLGDAGYCPSPISGLVSPLHASRERVFAWMLRDSGNNFRSCRLLCACGRDLEIAGRHSPRATPIPDYTTPLHRRVPKADAGRTPNHLPAIEVGHQPVRNVDERCLKLGSKDVGFFVHAGHAAGFDVQKMGGAGLSCADCIVMSLSILIARKPSNCALVAIFFYFVLRGFAW